MKTIIPLSVAGAVLLAAVPHFVTPALERIEPMPVASKQVTPKQVPTPAKLLAQHVPQNIPEIVGTEESKNYLGQQTQKIVRYADGTTEITDTDYNSRGQVDRITTTHRDGGRSVRDITYLPSR
jgi:hypothetical protein